MVDGQTKDITQGHAHGKVPAIPNYSTICIRRITKLNIKIDNNKNKEFKDEYITIAIDGTGIKVTTIGQLMGDK